MKLSTRVLGASIVRTLQERTVAPVLIIGSDRFDRADLSSVECFNFTAAANLSRILSVELAVRNTRELFDRIDPLALALPRLGAISLAVLGAAFEAKGLGGEAPLEAWVTKHRAAMNGYGKREFVTFDTMKHHRDHDQKKTRKPRKSRRTAA